MSERSGGFFCSVLLSGDVCLEFGALASAAPEDLQVAVGDAEDVKLAAPHRGAPRDPFHGNFAPSRAGEEGIEAGFRVDGEIGGLELACGEDVFLDDFEVVGEVVDLDAESMSGQQMKAAVANPLEIGVAVKTESPAVAGAENYVIALRSLVDQVGNFRDVGEEISVHHEDMGRLRRDSLETFPQGAPHSGRILAMDDGDFRVAAGQIIGDRSGGIGAVVVDHDDAADSIVIAAKQSLHQRSETTFLVAHRYNHGQGNGRRRRGRVARGAGRHSGKKREAFGRKVGTGGRVGRRRWLMLNDEF